MRCYLTQLMFVVGLLLVVSTTARAAVQGASGPAWHPSYEPATPVAAIADGAALALVGGAGDVDKRYAPTGSLALAPASGGIKLSAWRGERVSAQIVISAGVTQANLRVESAMLRNGASTGEF